MECRECLSTNVIPVQNKGGFVAGKCLDCGKVNVSGLTAEKYT